MSNRVTVARYTRNGRTVEVQRVQYPGKLTQWEIWEVTLIKGQKAEVCHGSEIPRCPSEQSVWESVDNYTPYTWLADYFPVP